MHFFLSSAIGSRLYPISFVFREMGVLWSSGLSQFCSRAIIGEISRPTKIVQKIYNDSLSFSPSCSQFLDLCAANLTWASDFQLRIRKSLRLRVLVRVSSGNC
ncbi:hypothetical protein AAC387_Pa07g0309 [Persea americana]